MRNAIIIILSIPLLCLGQIQNNKLLKPVILYGSHLENTPSESGKNITIIKSDEILNYNVQSIDELLKLIPSIELQSRGGFGNQSDIVLRGTTFNQTLVLLDGMRVNDPLTGHFSMYIPITISDIHQIEIIRGGASSTYGPDAVGGVINIVTKAFNNIHNPKELIIEKNIGSNNLSSNHIFLSRTLNQKLYSTFSLYNNQSDGQELYEDIFSFFNHNTLSISHHYNINNKFSISLRSAYAKRYFNSQYYYTRSSYDQSNETIEKVWTQTKMKYIIDTVQSISFHTTYQISDDIYIFNPGFPSYENTTKLINSRINYMMNKKTFRLATGMDLQKRSMVSIDRGNHKDYYIGGYVNYSKKVHSISFNPSIRIDYNKHYNLQICPQLDISYNTENYVYRSSVGRTIRSADFTERFYNNNYSGTLSSGRNIGNPSLNAEITTNFEIGIDVKKFKSVKFNNTVFYRNSSNLIDWVLMDSDNIETNIDLLENETYLFAENISKLHTIGFESELWFTILKNSKLNIYGSGGYLKIFSSTTAEDLLYDGGISSKYLANNSGDRLNYNLYFDFQKLQLNFNGIAKVRDSENDLTINQSLNTSYFIHNFKANMKIANNTKVGMEIINIFNIEYGDLLGAIMPKRWLIMSLTYNI